MVVQFVCHSQVNPVLENSPVALEPKICFLGRSVISYLCTGTQWNHLRSKRNWRIYLTILL